MLRTVLRVTPLSKAQGPQPKSRRSLLGPLGDTSADQLPDPGPARPANADRMSAVAAAYTAAHGHPLEHSGLEEEARRRRWSVTLRATLGAVIVVLLVVAGVVLTDLARSAGEPVTLGAVDPEAAESGASVAATPQPSPTTVDPNGAATGDGRDDLVVVQIVGQVVSPGVVEVPRDARLVEAIAMVGGLTAEADPTAVNLARAVVDGEQIYVPAVGEDLSNRLLPNPAPTTAAGAPGSPGQTSGLVNINTADLAALDSLPGIGPALAQRILDWRTNNGTFADVDELQEVSGIGPAVLAKLRDLVTV